MGYGRFNTAGTSRLSPWTNITEIEFYGTSALSVHESDLEHTIALYPVPAKDVLHIKNMNSQIKSIQVFSLDGRKVIDKIINTNTQELSLDTSSLVSGAYFVNLSNKNQVISKMIVISN